MFQGFGPGLAVSQMFQLLFQLPLDTLLLFYLLGKLVFAGLELSNLLG